MHAGKPEALYSSTLEMNDRKQIDIPELSLSLTRSFISYSYIFHSFIHSHLILPILLFF